MIKFSTRLPFCVCFHPTWIWGKQQGSLGKLWLAETWKMVCCYWPYFYWCPLLNLNKVAILTHYFYNVTHFFQTWNLAQSDILPKWFSWKKKIVSILALVQILADVIQKAQANSIVVCPSVRLFVGPSVHNDQVGNRENAHFCPCPPVRNWWPCIWPC